jgi:hypothetical protein
MAIKNLVPQLAERGKIKIGYKGEEKTSGQGKKFGQPTKLDCFLITTVQRDAAGRLMADKTLMSKFGKEGDPTIPEGPYKGLPLIKEIPVRLLYDDIELNFLTRYASYQGNRCTCSGDGEAAQRLAGQNGKFQEVQCPCNRQDPLYQGNDRCKIMGTLQVLIEGTDRIGGVWKFRTTSYNTVTGILSSLAMLKTITGGPLSGIPLWMVVSPKTVTVPTSGQAMVAYVVSLEYRGAGRKRLEIADGHDVEVALSVEEELTEIGYEIVKRRIANKMRMDNIEAEARKMLVAPHAESILEQAETGAEFFPENFLANGKDPGASASGAGSDNDPLGLDGGARQENVYTIPRDTKPGPQFESGASITLPALMEFAKNPSEPPITLPITLATNQGAPIGRWLDYALSPEGEIQVTLELVPNLKDVAQGLTVEVVKQSFAGAGIDLVINQPKPVEAAKKEAAPKSQGAGMALF